MNSFRAYWMLVAVILGCIASTAFGELAVKVETPGPIVATLTVPDGEHKIAWRCDDGLKYLASANSRTLGLWGLAGDHWLEATVTTDIRESRDILVPGPNWPTDPTDIKREKLEYLVDRTTTVHKAEFTIEGGPAPGPKPLPPPKPNTLGALVPDEARQDCVDFYASWAKAIRTNQCATTGHFQAAHAESMKSLQDILGASGWAAINGPIRDKIAAAIGTDDVALDAEKRAALATVLDAIATEFRGE